MCCFTIFVSLLVNWRLFISERYIPPHLRNRQNNNQNSDIPIKKSPDSRSDNQSEEFDKFDERRESTSSKNSGRDYDRDTFKGINNDCLMIFNY